MRPSANDILERMSNFRSSLLNKYTLEAPSSVSNVTIVFANHIQSIWAITEYPCRSQDDLEVTKRVELTSIQQQHVTRLEIKVRFTVNGERFAELNFCIFHSFQQHKLCIMALFKCFKHKAPQKFSHEKLHWVESTKV